LHLHVATYQDSKQPTLNSIRVAFVLAAIAKSTAKMRPDWTTQAFLVTDA
jgi:hypothetical protein